MEHEEFEIQNQETLSNLSRKIRLHECCAFIGSGLSRLVSYPLWSDLLLTLSNEAKKLVEESINDEQLDNYDKAEIYKEILGAEKYTDIVSHEFDPDNDKQPFSSTHLDLIELPFISYITTNYDLVIDLTLEMRI